MFLAAYEDSMRIIGGSVTSTSVSLHSDEYTVTSKLNKKTGVITSDIRRLNRLNRFLLHHPYLPPRTIFFTLQLLSNSSRKMFWWTGGIFLAVLVIATALLMYIGVEDTEKTTGEFQFTSYALRPFTLVIVLAIYRVRVAGFHGAEHMATSAYERFGIDGIERIAEGYRFSATCLCRYLVPGVLLSVFTFLGLLLVDKSAIMFSALMWEGFLWLDTTVGINNITLTTAITKFVQEYVITKPPNEQELRTGQEALRQLLLAHKEL